MKYEPVAPVPTPPAPGNQPQSGVVIAGTRTWPRPLHLPRPLPCPFPAPFPAPRLRTPARLAQVLWPPSSPRAWPEPRLRRLSGAWGWLDSPCVGGCALAGRGQRPWPWPGICGCRPAFLVGLAGEGRRGGFWCGQSPGPVTSCRIRVMAAIGTRCCCRRPASP